MPIQTGGTLPATRNWNVTFDQSFFLLHESVSDIQNFSIFLETVTGFIVSCNMLDPAFKNKKDALIFNNSSMQSKDLVTSISARPI
jgi:hypothetical protein